MNYEDDSAIKTGQVLLSTNGETTENTEASDIALLNKLMQWLKDSEGALSESDWRIYATEAYEFYAGKQDTAEVLEILANQNRSASVYNEVKPKIDMLIGLASQNRKAPMLFPVEDNDTVLAELMNGVFKHYRRTAKVARNEVECFEHMVKSGRALLHFYIAGEDPFNPEIRSKRISGRDFWLDPFSTEYDMSDARFLFVDKYFAEDDLKYYFPDLDPEEIKNLSQSNPNNPSFYSYGRDLYRVTECWYRQVEKVFWVKNPLTQKSEALSEQEYKDLQAKIKNGITLPNGSVLSKEQFEVVEKRKRAVRYAVFSNTKIIESGSSPYKHNDFPYILFGAYKDDDENRWFGAIEAMKDPQRGINVMRRQLQYLLQTAPKGIFLHEVGSVLDIESYEKHSSEPNFHMELAQGALAQNRIQFTTQPQVSPVYGQLIGMDTQMMKDASGIQDSLLGVQTSSREPGVTVRMRQETGLAVLFVIFDNYRESRMQAGKQLLSLIQQFVTKNQLIRIEGSEGTKLLEINSQKNKDIGGFNDITVGKYDLVVDEAVENQTMRMSVAQMLTEYSHNNPGTIPPELILEYSDLPISTINKVRDYTKSMLEREERMKMIEVESNKQVNEQKLAIEKMGLEMKGQIAELNSLVKILVADISAKALADRTEENNKEKETQVS